MPSLGVLNTNLWTIFDVFGKNASWTRASFQWWRFSRSNSAGGGGNPLGGLELVGGNQARGGDVAMGMYMRECILTYVLASTYVRMHSHVCIPLATSMESSSFRMVCVGATGMGNHVSSFSMEISAEMVAPTQNIH